MNDFIRINIGQPLDAGELLVIARNTKRLEQMVLASAGIVDYAKVSKPEFTLAQMEQAMIQMRSKCTDAVMRNAMNLRDCSPSLNAINLIDVRAIIESVNP